MAGKKLQGQVAIITGAGRGIGAATARRLCAAGAAVVLAARSEEEVETVAKLLRKEGGRAIAVAGDVSELETVEEIVESALEQFDRVDILINNAGVIWPIEEVADVDPEEWAYALLVNVAGPLFMARNVLPVMIDQGYGRIVNVSSHAAAHPIAGVSAYGSAKAALEMLTRTLALEVGDRKVTVNALRPGSVDTMIQEEIRSVDTTGSRLDTSYWHNLHTSGKLKNPQETASLLYWLVGPWSRTRNGEIFDGEDDAWVAQVMQDVA